MSRSIFTLVLLHYLSLTLQDIFSPSLLKIFKCESWIILIINALSTNIYLVQKIHIIIILISSPIRGPSIAITLLY